jgi:Domain of unknown function (DUF4436)
MTDEAPPAPAPTGSRGLRIVIGVGIVVAIIVIYVLSLFAVHLLAKSKPPLPPVDLGKFHEADSIVQLRVDDMKTVANRLSINVLVYPEDKIYDENFGVLKADTAVRLYLGKGNGATPSDLGDLQYPVGKAPAQVPTTIAAHGDPGNWPFDSYTTDEISAVVYTGNYHEKVSARIEVTGSVEGWDVSVDRVHDVTDTEDPNSLDDVTITLHRAKSQLIFDLGICLILIALPALALIVAIPMALGRTSFLPPFSTWYAAMLFAIVPLRNFFPGSPPPGSWVDQAIVLWVLIALVTAMSLFVVAWVRQRDRKPPKKS